MLTWTVVSHFEKSSPQPEIKIYLEFHFNLRSGLLDFQSFTEKPVLESAFAHPIMLFLSNVVKNSMDCVSDMQISYEMEANAHVAQLAVSL